MKQGEKAVGLAVETETCREHRLVRKPAGIKEVKKLARYGKKAQQYVEKAMHKYKRGDLTSGKKGGKVKSRKQAIAIGLSEAREKGAKVPRKK